MSKQSITKKSNPRRFVQMMALFLILIVFPIGTYYFTKSGHDYFKEMINEFHEYGQLPSFAIQNYRGDILKKEDLKSKVLVIGFFNQENQQGEIMGQQMAKLYDQFKEDELIVFVLKTIGADESLTSLNKYAQSINFSDHDNCYILGKDQAGINTLLNAVKMPTDYGQINKSEPYNLSSIDTPIENYPYLVIADTGHVIRNYYAFDDNLNMARMVEHIALLMPSRGDNKPVLEREKEK